MAKLTRAELMRVNRELKAQGRRICPDCWREYPLTDAHWYRHVYHSGRRAGHWYWGTYCRTCEASRASEASRKRYHASKAERERKKAQSMAWQQANPDKVRRIQKRYRRSRVARKLAAVMAKTEAEAA